MLATGGLLAFTSIKVPRKRRVSCLGNASASRSTSYNEVMKRYVTNRNKEMDFERVIGRMLTFVGDSRVRDAATKSQGLHRGEWLNDFLPRHADQWHLVCIRYVRT